jgi:HSP20 family protein
MPSAEWDPLKELARIQSRMNQLFESALARTDFDADSEVGSWVPPADVYETTSSLVVCVELPGLRQPDIDVRIDGEDLVVQGERRMERSPAEEQYHRVERPYGKFLRRFRLPADADRSSTQADYADGVLRIRLRRSPSPPGTIKVAVK